MSCRYHKLPSEILELELNDFNLNSIILLKAVEKQQEEADKIKSNQGRKTTKTGNTNFSNFNLGRTIKKQGEV